MCIQTVVPLPPSWVGRHIDFGMLVYPSRSVYHKSQLLHNFKTIGSTKHINLKHRQIYFNGVRPLYIFSGCDSCLVGNFKSFNIFMKHGTNLKYRQTMCRDSICNSMLIFKYINFYMANTSSLNLKKTDVVIFTLIGTV